MRIEEKGMNDQAEKNDVDKVEKKKEERERKRKSINR